MLIYILNNLFWHRANDKNSTFYHTMTKSQIETLKENTIANFDCKKYNRNIY